MNYADPDPEIFERRGWSASSHNTLTNLSILTDYNKHVCEIMQ